ncbi:MAG: hypothetical protein PVJ76_22030, partial [Gemmatimonadota bacterium]
MAMSGRLPLPRSAEGQTRAIRGLQLGIALLSLLTVVFLATMACTGGKSGDTTGPQASNVTFNVTVQGAGDGQGTVSGSQLSCQIQGGQAGATGCQGTRTFSSNSLPTTVTITASPQQGSAFVTWGGACASAGSNPSCQMTVSASPTTQNHTITARFDLLPGAIQVTTVTTGSDLDSDGYTVTIDQSAAGAIQINDIQTYSNLTAGTYSVSLTGLADNCTVNGQSPRDVTVNPGATAQTTFNVTCAATTGSIEVTTVTNGNAGDLDDEYTLTIEPVGAADETAEGDGPTRAQPPAPVAMGINTTQTVSQLAPGNYTVTLGDIATNCTLDVGENPRTLAVEVGQTTQTTFTLSCTPTTGSIQVTTTTQGNAQDLDPDGYTLTVDQAAPVDIDINDTQTISGLAPGDHTVTLGDIFPGCTVDAGENPRTVTVVAGQTTPTTFSLTCSSGQGSILVTTITLGDVQNVDPDGYTVTIDQGAPTAIGLDENLTFDQIAVGNHDVTLGDVAGTCSVFQNNPQTVNVGENQLIQVIFNVTCGTPTGIQVKTSTLGGWLPESLTVSVNQGAQVPIGADLDSYYFSPLAPGSHEVAMAGIPPTCTLTGDNPRTVTVVAGQLAITTFALFCVPPHQLAFEQVSPAGDSDICLLDPFAQNPVVTCLTAGNGFDDVHPTWSPNQTEIIFSSNRDGDFEIYRMNPDGTGVTQLTQNNAWDSEPHYYVFGQKIVFTSDRSGNKDIWQMDLTQPGYPVTQLTTDPGMDFNPAWVFDTGYWMWTSDRDGDLDIWRDGPGGMSQQTNNPENED